MREELLQRARIDRPVDGRMPDQRGEFRGKGEEARPGRVEDRLFPKSVAGGEQALARPVPDDECEHAVQPRRQILAPFLISMHQNFGVGMVAAEDMPCRKKLLAQLGMVVYFAVEEDTHRGILVPHRLMPACDVDDRQAAESEVQRVFGLDMKSRLVRTAMDDGIGHRMERAPPAGANKAGQSAHGASAAPARWRAAEIDQLAGVIDAFALRFEIGARDDLGDQAYADAHDAHHEGHHHEQRQRR